MEKAKQMCASKYDFITTSTFTGQGCQNLAHFMLHIYSEFSGATQKHKVYSWYTNWGRILILSSPDIFTSRICWHLTQTYILLADILNIFLLKSKSCSRQKPENAKLERSKSCCCVRAAVLCPFNFSFTCQYSAVHSLQLVLVSTPTRSPGSGMCHLTSLWLG